MKERSRIIVLNEFNNDQKKQFMDYMWEHFKDPDKEKVTLEAIKFVKERRKKDEN